MRTNNLLTLAKFVGTDPTRQGLNYCFDNERLKAKVATNGHRALIDYTLYGSTNFNGIVYQKTQEILKPMGHEKFPDIASVYPNIAKIKHKIEWDIPEWIEKISKYKRPVPLFFTNTGDVTLTKTSDALVSIDARLFSGITGVRAQIKIIDNASPIIVIIRPGELEALIMPLRM